MPRRAFCSKYYSSNKNAEPDDEWSGLQFCIEQMHSLVLWKMLLRKETYRTAFMEVYLYQRKEIKDVLLFKIGFELKTRRVNACD
jgi:hypothetical protein